MVGVRKVECAEQGKMVEGMRCVVWPVCMMLTMDMVHVMRMRKLVLTT